MKLSSEALAANQIGGCGALERPRHYAQVPVLVEAALEGERVLRPGLQYDVEALREAVAALFYWHAEVLVLPVQEPAAHAPVQPAATEDVDHGHVFGDPDGPVEG